MKTQFLAALILALPLRGMALDAYFIGNSLTWDMQPDALAALAQQSGGELHVGYHIRAGQPLVYTAGHPDDITFANGYGGYDKALPNHAWDIVTLQPYIGAGSTLGTDLAAIDQFIELTRSGPSTQTRFYIYAGWPNAQSWTWPTLDTDAYQAAWSAPAANNPAQPTTLSAQYFNDLYDDAVAAHPEQSIYLIPVGQVFARLDQEIRAGQLDGFSSVYDLYRDPVHLSYDIGRFIAAMTTYATLFGQSPVGLELPPGFFTVDETPGGALSPLVENIALRNQLADIVWDVVSGDYRTGVAAVPLPATAWLFCSALLGLAAGARRGKCK